ncbi:MAG: GNAT family N-acetyltransferase, partial [Anaerolineales bacterium]
MNEGFTIRFVEETDLIALEWEGEYYRFRNMYRDIYNQSLKGNALLWVIEINGAGVIGQIFSQLNSGNPKLADGKRRAYLFSFRIKQRYQGQGWGSLLLKHA